MRRIPGIWYAALLISGGLGTFPAFADPADNPTNAPAPLQPSELLKQFAVKRGFRLELAAAEPLVVNPVAMAFDENSRLFVLERNTDPDQGPGPAGRVRVLEDADGDGTFDASTIFARKLDNPSALICYGGGVFVAAGAEILYFKDSKHDGVADARRVVFQGFSSLTNGADGHINITGMAWGLDNRIHVATASREGDIFSSSSPVQSIVLKEGCFSFDPRGFQLTPESGSAPVGMALDDRGRRLVASNRRPTGQVMLESRYAARNPLYTPPAPTVNLAASGIEPMIYSFVPPEPARVPGPARAGATTPVTSLNRPAPRRFSAISGVLVYTGNAFPPAYVGDIFLVDADANVVHHEKLATADLQLTASRPADEPGMEFLAERDRSFQPIQLANAPDGALYVCGLIRPGLAPAPTNVPPVTVMAPDEITGSGRIYRIVPLVFKPLKTPRLGQMSSALLVAELRHPNGWHRETASRLLYERQDRAAFVLLAQLLNDLRAPPQSRVRALQALDGTGQLTAAHLAKAMIDPDDHVREQAIRLSEKLIKNGEMPDNVFGQVARLASDPVPQVRYQAALTLGQLQNQGRFEALASAAVSDPNSPWMRAAVLTSLSEGAVDIFAFAGGNADMRNQAGGVEFLRQIIALVAAKNQAGEITRLLEALGNIPEALPAFNLTRLLGEGLQSANNSLAAADVAGVVGTMNARALREMIFASDPDPPRSEAIRLLDATDYNDPKFSSVLVANWRLLDDSLASDAVVALLNRPDRTADLITGLERGVVPLTALTSAQIRFLTSHPDSGIRARAGALYGNPAAGSRANVVNDFAPSLQFAADPNRGRGIFLQRCANCHQIAGRGNSSGLDLTRAARTGGQKLLVKIIAPNVQPPTDNAETLVKTKSGATLTGFVVAQAPVSVTLLQANGVARVIGRNGIDSITSLHFSPMPEGLEAGLGAREMADLLAFLTSSAAR